MSDELFGGKPYRKGRPSKLEEPEFCKLVAQAFVDGVPREEMANIFDVSAWTITQWRKDPRIKAHCIKLIEDRVLRVTSRVDALIEKRLQNAADMETDTLLKIRKEFLGGAFRVQVEGKADDKTVNEALSAIENDPDFLKALEQLQEKAGK